MASMEKKVGYVSRAGGARVPLYYCSGRIGAGGKRVGRGFFSSLWKGVKSAVPAVFNVAKDAVKKSGILGNLASSIPGVGAAAGAATRALGYGRSGAGMLPGRTRAANSLTSLTGAHLRG